MTTDKPSLKKNDIIELPIEGYSSEGSGVGHYNGQAVFVNGAAAGDTAECLIIKAKSSYAVGKLRQIIKDETKDIRTILYAKAFADCEELSEEDLAS